MKKTYIIPQVNTVRLQAERMLAGSNALSASGIDGFGGYGGIDEDGSLDPNAKENFFGESIFD